MPNLTHSSYFHLIRLRAIRKSVSIPVFTSIVHAFVCSRINCYNSLLTGLPKVRLSPIQIVLDSLPVAYRAGGAEGASRPGDTPEGAELRKNVKIYVKNGQIYVKKVTFLVNTDKKAES